jgi:hypothetical protein
MCKEGRCKVHKSCEKLPVNETVETPLIVTLLVDCIELKIYRMSNKLLHIDSASRYTHLMQVKMEYCYISKRNERWRN